MKKIILIGIIGFILLGFSIAEESRTQTNSIGNLNLDKFYNIEITQEDPELEASVIEINSTHINITLNKKKDVELKPDYNWYGVLCADGNETI